MSNELLKREYMEKVIAASLHVAAARAYAEVKPDDGTAGWTVELYEDNLLDLLAAEESA